MPLLASTSVLGGIIICDDKGSSVRHAGARPGVPARGGAGQAGPLRAADDALIVPSRRGARRANRSLIVNRVTASPLAAPHATGSAQYHSTFTAIVMGPNRHPIMIKGFYTPDGAGGFTIPSVFPNTDLGAGTIPGHGPRWLAQRAASDLHSPARFGRRPGPAVTRAMVTS